MREISRFDSDSEVRKGKNYVQKTISVQQIDRFTGLKWIPGQTPGLISSDLWYGFDSDFGQRETEELGGSVDRTEKTGVW